jgi:hypothetical protein
MVVRGIVGGLVAAALLAVFASAAESGDAPDRPRGSEEVTVTGRRPSDQEAGSAISGFVAAHSKFTVIRQLSRWHSPVCPTVKNMPAAYGAFIANRIKTLARSVRARVEEPCRANITIIYTQKPQDLLNGIAKEKPALLGFHFDSQREELKTVTRPIQAWYITATNGIIDDAYGRRPGGVAGSRLTNGFRSELVHVLVVVDADFLAGHEIGPVADYIAMLALSHASAPNDCTRLATILSYLSPECPAGQRPQSLTAADRAYLEALYSISPEAFGNLQRSGIITYMNKSLAEPAAGNQPAGNAQPQTQ